MASYISPVNTQGESAVCSIRYWKKKNLKTVLLMLFLYHNYLYIVRVIVSIWMFLGLRVWHDMQVYIRLVCLTIQCSLARRHDL